MGLLTFFVCGGICDLTFLFDLSFALFYFGWVGFYLIVTSLYFCVDLCTIKLGLRDYVVVIAYFGVCLIV